MVCTGCLSGGLVGGTVYGLDCKTVKDSISRRILLFDVAPWPMQKVSCRWFFRLDGHMLHIYPRKLRKHAPPKTTAQIDTAAQKIELANTASEYFDHRPAGQPA